MIGFGRLSKGFDKSANKGFEQANVNIQFQDATISSANKVHAKLLKVIKIRVYNDKNVWKFIPFSFFEGTEIWIQVHSFSELCVIHHRKKGVDEAIRSPGSKTVIYIGVQMICENSREWCDDQDT